MLFLSFVFSFPNFGGIILTFTSSVRRKLK